jgi:RNA polymerase sigma-70 factor (ECF subfamily)
MSPTSKELLERWQAGDEQAADELYRRYVGRLGGLVADHLAERFRRQVDPEDLTQSAYRTFFRRAEAGEFHFDADADVWKLLVTIALNKVRRIVRRLTAGSRDIRKESFSSAGAMDHIADGPKFEDALIVADIVTHLAETLSDRHVELLKLRMEGHAQQEVAEQLGVTDRTVRRMMEQIRSELASGWDEDAT